MKGSKGEVPRHAHDSPRLNVVLSGYTTEIDDRGRKVSGGPLTLIYQPPGWTHGHIAETDLSFLCFDLSLQWMPRVADIAKELDRPLILTSPPVINAALRLHSEMWADDEASPMVLEALMIELLAESVRQPRPNTNGGKPRWLRRARDLIQDRYLDRLSLDEIAFAVAVHPSHLSRMYRSAYGETIGESIRRLRLEDGLRQLSATNLSIGEIAAQAGFCDNAHFTRECRRVLGVSPSEIRRSVQDR